MKTGEESKVEMQRGRKVMKPELMEPRRTRKPLRCGVYAVD